MHLWYYAAVLLAVLAGVSLTLGARMHIMEQYAVYARILGATLMTIIAAITLFNNRPC